MVTKKYWSGPLLACNCCDRPFGKVMYDCRLPNLGQWANICHNCFICYGAKLGIGSGQKYEQQPDGKWLKVA